MCKCSCRDGAALYGLSMGFAGLLASSLTAAFGQAGSAPIQKTEQSASVHGVVLNAGTRRPLARALVQVEGRSVLTGPDGRFEFGELSGTTTAVRVTKPGFYEGSDFSQTATKSATVGSTADVEVTLSPEALITGTISATNGDPLPQVQVQALRRIDDEAGFRWSVAGQTSTNADGQFRLPLPGGEYLIETLYVPERFSTHGAILPILVPASGFSGGGGDSGGGGTSSLRLASGSEQHLELHPTVRPSHLVHVQIDSSADATEGQFTPQIQVHLANGLTFSPQSHGAEKRGESVINLPNGSYMLSATSGFRDDQASYGETRLTVADEEVTGVTIHLQKALELSVEVSVDYAATAPGPATDTTVTSSSAAFDPALTGTINPTSASFVQQLGLFLERTDAGINVRTVSPSALRGDAVRVMLLPGSYRLRTRGYSPWFIESATAGGTDLLTQELVVDGGSSAVPLRLVVSNQTATVKGTTTLKEEPATCYVYLIATTPSASPVVTVRSGNDGSFSRTQIPPGSYKAVASETRLYLNLTDAAVQRKLAPYMKAVTVSVGQTENVDLDAVPGSELQP